MNRPSYNRDACKKLSFQQFIKLHEKIEFFKWFNESDWENEYERATGRKPVKKESDDPVRVERKSKKD